MATNYQTLGVVLDYNSLNVDIDWATRALVSTILKFKKSYNTQLVLFDIIPGMVDIFDKITNENTIGNIIIPLLPRYKNSTLNAFLPNIDSSEDLYYTNAWELTSDLYKILNECNCILLVWNGEPYGRCAYVARRALELNLITLIIDTNNRDIKMLAKAFSISEVLPIFDENVKNKVISSIEHIYSFDGYVVTQEIMVCVLNLIDYIHDLTDSFLISIDQLNMDNINCIAKLLTDSMTCLKKFSNK